MRFFRRRPYLATRRFFWILFHKPRLFHLLHKHDERGFCQ